jgi:hypothetical protein
MTTNKLSILYERGSSEKEPKVIVGLYVNAFQYLKLFVLAVLGRPQILWHEMTNNDLEGMANTIVRWRLVTKLKSMKFHGRSSR